MIKKSILFRHLLGIAACTAYFLGVWSIIYVKTYIDDTWVSHADPGRFLIGGILSVIYGLVVGIGIFAPASLAGFVLSLCLTCRFPRVVAAPFVLTVAAFLSYQIDGFYMVSVTTSPQRAFGIIMKDFVIYLSLPMLLYWWFTSCPDGELDHGPGGGPK